MRVVVTSKAIWAFSSRLELLISKLASRLERGMVCFSPSGWRTIMS